MYPCLAFISDAGGTHGSRLALLSLERLEAIIIALAVDLAVLELEDNAKVSHELLAGLERADVGRQLPSPNRLHHGLPGAFHYIGDVVALLRKDRLAERGASQQVGEIALLSVPVQEIGKFPLPHIGMKDFFERAGVVENRASRSK